MCICVYMQRMDFMIDDVLADEFRAVAYMVGKHRKGSLSKAIEKAMEMWIKKIQHSSLTRSKLNRKMRKSRD